ncbi:huntingtin isoform X1 [Diprion similis]|uniref:huntingtin isoform X1 n=2 Tax=Diprion similis TaxID=362088 RepID=UPI001EF77D5D|nr:huntingtin isoform X1 [Diprion similis]
MATINGILKAVDTLKNLHLQDMSHDYTARKKEKIGYCTTVADGICSSAARLTPKFTQVLNVAIETLLMLCDDSESDVRMVADECLNRIIRGAMTDGNIMKVQIVLYCEIKKNGAARTLRTALWRFAQLGHMIRPLKGKAYVANLIPCIVAIAQRSEESVIETLANSLPLILKTLGNFTTDSNVKTLLNAFCQNIPSPQAVFRRTAANMILTTCLNSRNPQAFLLYVLQYMIDTLVPITDDEDRVTMVIGVFGCLRIIIPHIDETSNLSQPDVPLHSFIQVYELCLHFAKWHSDHNVVNAALETLAQLLQFPLKELVPILVSHQGITRSRITMNENTARLSLGPMSGSNVTISGKNSESTLNLFDPDIPEIKPTVEKWIVDSENVLPVIQRPHIKQADTNQMMGKKEKSLENYSSLIIGSLDSEGVEEESDTGSDILKAERSTDLSLPSLQSKEDEYLDEVSSSVTSLHRTSSGVLYHECDIGTFTDADVPLKYCCRYLVSSFLLTGIPGQLIPDKIFRVSVKSLALTCIGHILRLYPNLLLSTMDKTPNSNVEQQYISDILLFANHSDPQIRGNVAMVIGYFLKAVFLQSGDKYRNMEIFLRSTIPDRIKDNILSLENLTALLLEGLKDESATTCRQTLLALNLCLADLIESANNKYALPILKALPLLVKNPYFLVKIKLVEVLSNLPYTTVEYVTGGSHFQKNVISVMVELLGDQDQRVRHATASAIVQIIPLLYYQHPHEDTVTRKASKLTERHLSDMISNPLENSSFQTGNNSSFNSLPKPFDLLCQQDGYEYDERIESVLSRIISLLTQKLVIGSSKYLNYGCCETLSLLSETFLTTIYPRAWDCLIPKTTVKKTYKRSNSRGDTINEATPAGGPVTPTSNALISLTVSFLSSSPLSLDLSTHRHLMLLAGNLASGIAMCNLKPNEPLNNSDSEPVKLWGLFKEKQIHQHFEQLLTHVIRILNTFVHVIDEVHLQHPNTKSALPPLPTAQALSPKRKLISDQKSKDKEEKTSSSKFSREQMGVFTNFPHYMKLYEILKAANTNYKSTLESEASKMYLSLLNATLQVLSQILEIATIHEAGRIAEEILHYLQTTVILSPTATVQCVQQLLKCLFGSNLSIRWTDPDYQKNFERRNFRDDSKGFYTQCFQTPARQMADMIKTIGNTCRSGNDPSSGWIGLVQRKGDRKMSSVFRSLSRHSDQKASVASFIRLFEPMVIKSLKQYTVTSCVSLQCRVLLLLSQLVQLRVNYCLLDQDQIFIGFVLKQFEFIEEGYIQETEELIPKIFNFLVQLSYEKYHSKVIIGIPKIIQLCDGLMASGQSPPTHCIPALVPLIEDIFLIRGSSSTVAEQKELETTRDVLVSMLLRLVEYHEVIQLLAACLMESRYSSDGNGEEKWTRWSRLTIDSILPVLASGKVRLESKEAHIALVKLFSAVSPTVFRPVDPLLKVLFIQAPNSQDSVLIMERWLGMVNVVLLALISYAKEEAMLARLSDLSLYNANFYSGSVYTSKETMSDPLNVRSASAYDIAPEKVLARFLFKVIGLITSKVYDLVGLINYKNHDCYLGAANSLGNDNYLVQQFAFFLQLCIHMFESGSHCKVANATMQMMQGRNVLQEDKLMLTELNSLMLQLGSKCPILTCQWAYLMTLLSYSEMSFWEEILAKQSPNNAVRSTLSRYNASAMNSDQIEPMSNLCNINGEIVRKGSTILFCDYVCENINDAEPLTWLLVNHIEETISLAREPPVKELLAAAVHRNPAASGLLVQAIAARCLDLSKPSFVKRLLQCLEGTHQSQSGALILAMVPRLLTSKYLALCRLAAKIASRRAEILLTLSTEDIKTQLPRDDFMEMMNILLSTRLAKKYGGLVSLLNKLGAQHYDLSPLELEQRRPFNPSSIRGIQLDRNWFYLQTKLRCCHNNRKYSLLESAELLGNMNYEDTLQIMSSNDFNLKIVKECFKLGIRYTVKKCQELGFSRNDEETDIVFEEGDLYKAAKECLLQHVQNINELVPKQREIFHPIGRDMNTKEAKYVAKLSELMNDNVYWNTLLTIIPSVTVYIETLPALLKYGLSEINSKFEDVLAKFGLLCFEVIHWMLKECENNKRKLKPEELEVALRCAEAILKNQNLHKAFGNNHYWVCTASATLTRIVEHLLASNQRLPVVNSCGLKPALENNETRPYAQACIEMAMLVAWLEKHQGEGAPDNIPLFLFNPIKSLIITVSREPLVNSFVLTPPLVWKHGWHVVGSGPTKCLVPLLSSESNLLHEVDVLEQFIYRLTLLGWTSRLQFEETWMALLSVLNITQNEGMSFDELAVSIQATSLAVQAITNLLTQTLLLPCPGNPVNSTFIHQSRDPQLSLHKISSQKLYLIQETLISKFEYVNESKSIHGLTLDHIFHRGNIERVSNRHQYSYSQFSLPFLWASCSLHEDKLSSSVLELKKYRNNVLESLSLDLNSCLHFLLELYSSWTLPRVNTPLRLLNEVTKSILAISELFTERSQYQWMLDTCLDLSRVHPIENEILHQYLVIAVCKATAVLAPLDSETLEKVKRLIETSLKSGFLPARVFALQGTLYLLQSAVFADCEETMNIIHPLAIEYIQKHIDTQDSQGVLSQSEEHQGVMWALVFFLLEHAEDTPPDAEAPAVLELVLSLVNTQNISTSLHQTLLQGLERLVATKSVVGKVAEQIVKVAVDRLKQASPILALPALQLLLTCMYTGAAEKLNNPEIEEPLPDEEPEVLVQSIERTSAIFDRIKKGYPMEVEVLCGVLPGVLGDFFPPWEILTKVIGEFLSPQQPHPRLLSAVVFQVCERACNSAQLGLLQEWVVFSLPNFIQSLPIAMSTWCLSCFFISASTNPWLRAFFPHVQSRIGKYEYEDKKILCISAADFYQKLSNTNQKMAFVETFESAAKEPGTPFSDILASL